MHGGVPLREHHALKSPPVPVDLDRPQLRVLSPKLRAQVVGVFVDDVVESFDGVKAHRNRPVLGAEVTRKLDRTESCYEVQ